MKQDRGIAIIRRILRFWTMVRPAALCSFFLVSWLLLPVVSVGVSIADDSGVGMQSPPVPKRELHLESAPKVSWKILWDEGRALARAGEYTSAISKYEELFRLKNNLAEAKWEFARILLLVHQEDRAILILDQLIELEPERLVFQRVLGFVLLEKGQNLRAADLLARVYEKDSEDRKALAGVVNGLLAAGKKEEALPFLEKLYQKNPADRKIQKKLATLYCELERYRQARPYLVDLAEQQDVGLDILLMAARVHEELGLANLAVEYWKRVIVRSPQNLQGRQHLAAYYEKTGQGEKALSYLLPLAQQNKTDPILLKRVGRIYSGMKRFAEALPYLERYVSLRSDDRDVLREIVSIYASLGDKAASLAFLERLIALEPDPDPVNLRQAAVLYEASGRYDKAILLYERVLRSTPDDPEVLARLAKAMLAAGKQDDALALWKRLAGRRKLFEVLHILHRLDPEDGRVTFKLAKMYLDQGELEKSLTLFDQLAKAGFHVAGFQASRAELFEKLDLPEAALKVYEEILRGDPDRSDIRLRCVRLAGRLGLLGDLRQHLDQLGLAPVVAASAEAVDTRLAVAFALRKAGAYDDAQQQYAYILKSGSGGLTGRHKALLGLFRTYRDAGRLYESEQALRMALASGYDRPAVLQALFDLSLYAGRFDDAAVWFEGLAGIDPSGAPLLAKNDEVVDPRLMQARLLAAKGEYADAIKIVRHVFAGKAGKGTNALEGVSVMVDRFGPGILLGRLLLAAGRFQDAENLCQDLSLQSSGDFKALALLAKIYKEDGKLLKSRDAASKALTLARRDLGALLDLASFCRSEAMPSLMEQAASAAVTHRPQSLKARLLLAQALILNNDIRGALTSLGDIVQDYPDNSRAAYLLAGLLFTSGSPDLALARCEDLLKNWPGRPELLLLKARILWSQGMWSDSEKIYDDFCSPPIAEVFVEKTKALGITDVPPLPERSFWEIVTFSNTEKKSFVDTVMKSSCAVDDSLGKRKLNMVAAPLYAGYRWQRRFLQEKAVRMAVQRREYLHAAQLYEVLIRDYPGQESLLFDLAGIYSRLGKLEEEAAVYERLAAVNAVFPGLAEARQRNCLKRRPRVAAGYGYKREEGREGYKGMQKEWAAVDFLFSPRIQHEASFSFSRINYRSTEQDTKIRGTRTVINYKAKNLLDWLTFSFGGGVEALQDGSDDTALLDGALNIKIGDKLKGRMSYGRDVVADTTASLSRHIVAQNFGMGAQLDLFPRLQVGGDYTATDYSDNNRTSRYDLWTAYILFSDPYLLKFGYKYDFADSREGRREGGVLAADGYAADDHPYWAPTNYWINEFSVSFRHQLSDDILGRGIPRYYSAEYSVGYDSKGYAIQTWKGGFHAELTKHYILQATAGITTSPEYRSRDLFVSAAYRW